jgi:NADH dehydrogenase
MGARLVRGLVDAGNRVRVLTLPGDPYVARLADVNCEIVYGDVADAGSLNGIFDGVQTVYHLAAVIIASDDRLYQKINVDGVSHTVAGARQAGVEHFIHISSAATDFPEASAYAASKLAGEKIVRAQDTMHTTIVRPTLAYERNGGQEFMLFVDFLKKFPVVPFIGAGRARKSPVHTDDLVKGFLAIAHNPLTYGKTYNFSGGETITIKAFARLVLRHLGLVKPILPLPVFLCRGAAFLMERFMTRPPLTRYAISRIELDADLDHALAEKDLGYTPMGVTEGLAKCYPPERR